MLRKSAPIPPSKGEQTGTLRLQPSGVVSKTRLYPGESLVILDGVEHFPPARQALKALLEDGRFDYVESGAAAPAGLCAPYESVPFEEHVIEVPPLDFEE